MIDWVICIIKGFNSQHIIVADSDDVFIEKITKGHRSSFVFVSHLQILSFLSRLIKNSLVTHLDQYIFLVCAAPIGINLATILCSGK